LALRQDQGEKLQAHVKDLSAASRRFLLSRTKNLWATCWPRTHPLLHSAHAHVFSSPAGIDSRRWSWAGKPVLLLLAESAVQDPADPRPGPCSSLVLFLLLFYFLDLISVNRPLLKD